MECTLEILNLSKDTITKHLVSGFCLCMCMLMHLLCVWGVGRGELGVGLSQAGGEGETEISISIQCFSRGQFFISNTKEVVVQPILLNFNAVFFRLWEIKRLQTFPDSQAGLTYIFGKISSFILQLQAACFVTVRLLSCVHIWNILKGYKLVIDFNTFLL